MQVLHHICQAEGLTLNRTKVLTGGDINQVYLLETDEGPWVIKINNAQHYPGMFQAEAAGLELLRNSNSFKIPQVRGEGLFEDITYLLLEFIPEGRGDTNFWPSFGEQLAQLHRNSDIHFGLDHDNYIGSLPQKNEREDNVVDFYIRQRLRPQIELAKKQGFPLENYSSFEKRLPLLLPLEEPALLHGDLWSGNYMVSENGAAVLIDPAVSYGPREMDLAMMQLFGGFPSTVFDSYNEAFPLPTGWEDRIPLWQLYYLLVHLNLFGAGYLGQVEGIIRRYS